jgi:MFS family permease
MDARRARVHWAVAFAALVGGVAGSFVAPSMVSLGIRTGGSHPLLGGGAAIYVASVAGALLGVTSGALTAFVIRGRRHFLIDRRRHQWVAAITGSIAGIAVSVVAGYFSEDLARLWVNAFSANPLEAALVGGAMAGSFAGVAGAATLRTFQSMRTRASRQGKFTALSGSILGLLAGLGGGSIGATLAQSVIACPNGYYSNPSPPSGCVPGVLQGSLLLGLWAGAATGAVAALVTTTLLSRLATTVADSIPAN